MARKFLQEFYLQIGKFSYFIGSNFLNTLFGIIDIVFTELIFVISDSNDRTLIACSRHSDGGMQAKNIPSERVGKKEESEERGEENFSLPHHYLNAWNRLEI